jgi:hypothetical protein
MLLSCRSDEEADWELTAPYYRMAGLAPVDVVDRVKEMAVPPKVAARGKHRVRSDGQAHLCCLYTHNYVTQQNNVQFICRDLCHT